ncbi:hypothetical protein [Exiguobacterium acetylicum]|uniref:hypothetical protein n=1 Tax=Exiguobacterium acetylicum TaxID=41170 RepID=UPI0004942FD6|nr:hypothetical protein [Exiguobacterium acetylicum]
MEQPIVQFDSITISFEDKAGRRQSIDEFAQGFEHGILFFGHPPETSDIKVVLDLKTNFGERTFRFNFYRMDRAIGYYLIDGLVWKWVILWEWYYQESYQSGESYHINRPKEGLRDFYRQIDIQNETCSNDYLESGIYEEDVSCTDSYTNFENLDWVTEGDPINTLERMRNQGVFFEYYFKVWIDLEHSLPAIRRVIDALSIHTPE